MIQWFSSLNEFEQSIELYHKIHTVYFDRLCACTNITFEELQAILPLPPDPNPFPSEPGPHDYWYGCIDNLPFLISYHHSGNREGIMTSLRTFPSHPNQGDYFWSPLKKLVALPKPLMQRIDWLGFWEPNKQPVRSIYCYKTTSIGFDSPVALYQVETVIEAEALLNFLHSLQSDYTYYIDKPNSAKYRNLGE